jgi:hypothetical protein
MIFGNFSFVNLGYVKNRNDLRLNYKLSICFKFGKFLNLDIKECAVTKEFCKMQSSCC